MTIMDKNPTANRSLSFALVFIFSDMTKYNNTNFNTFVMNALALRARCAVLKKDGIIAKTNIRKGILSSVRPKEKSRFTAFFENHNIIASVMEISDMDFEKGDAKTIANMHHFIISSNAVFILPLFNFLFSFTTAESSRINHREPN